MPLCSSLVLLGIPVFVLTSVGVADTLIDLFDPSLIKKERINEGHLTDGNGTT